MRFRPIAGLADSSALADRTEVKYTVDGTCWFYGRTLPVQRTAATDQEIIEYVAADPIEFLGHNPVANDGEGTNRWYNRRGIDVSAYVYPVNRTIAQIIAAEFADIVGSSKDILALDFTDSAGGPSSVVPIDFEAKGKSRLGIIDALVGESPSLSYWYDPTTYTGDTTKGTLRFYDLAKSSGLSAKEIVLPRREPGLVLPTANCESLGISEDLSSSYDMVVIHGRGDMTETIEEPVADWTALGGNAIGATCPYLRRNADGAVEYFDHLSGPNGTWLPEAGLATRPYYPESDAPGYKEAFRRYSVSDDIADVKIAPVGTGSPTTYERKTQSMWLSVCQNVWNIGGSFRVGSTFYDVRLYANTTRVGSFGPVATVDNDGDVAPNAKLYPNYPVINDTDPLFPVPTPSAYERDRFVLKEPLVRRTEYLFPTNASGDATYNNLAGQPCFKYWQTDQGLTMRYTASVPLTVSFTDGGLGYNKRLDLWDERFLKYTDADGNVLRDDTTLLTDFAEPVWDLVKRKRYYGESIVHVTPTAGMLTDWMGKTISVVNYGSDAATRDIPARIQGVDLSHAIATHTLTVSYDRPNTFRPLSKFLEGREFFEGSVEDGQGKLEGKRGDRLVAPKAKVKKPLEDATGQGVTSSSSILADPGGGRETILRGTITARSAATGTATTGLTDPTVVKYAAETLDGAYATPAQQIPLLRPFNPGTPLQAAAIGSACLISVIPKSGASGYDVELLTAAEKVRQYLIGGTVTVAYSGGSPGSTPGRPLTIDYDWASEDGVYSGTRDYPLYRPYNTNPEVVPAPVNSECLILLSLDGSGGYEAELWSVQEELNFDECGTGGLFQYADDGVDFDTTHIIVNVSGEEIVNADGHLILSKDAPAYSNSPEERIITSKTGRTLYNSAGGVILKADDGSDGMRILDPSFIDSKMAASGVGHTVVSKSAEVLKPLGSSGGSISPIGSA